MLRAASEGAVAETNLPIQLTSFIGRGTEVAEVADAIGNSRLVTLIGPGGVGKTRLAIEAAISGRQRFRHGTWMVDLSPVSEDELVVAALSGSLGVKEEVGAARSPSSTAMGCLSGLFDQIVEYLQEKSALLLFDNCEHLASACALISGELVKGCPRVNILATSREPLRIPGEKVIIVPPLNLSRGADSKNPEATELFIERASLHDPSFRIAGDDLVLVEEICRKLDGLPLAIELAAAQIRTLTPAQILERLEDQLGLLNTWTTHGRHSALRSSMDWSYGLLSEPEQILMARLSVFAGGFSLEGAEGVCAGSTVTSHEVLGLLSRLVDKSLVLRDLRRSKARYRLLETVRQYGREKMNDPTSAAGRTAAGTPEQDGVALFRREGEFWTIGAPEESFHVRNSKGLQYLALLLAAPGKDFFVLDLVDVVEGGAKETRRAVGSAGELLDKEARRAYRQRLKDLLEELEESRQFNDPERASRLEDEMSRLSQELGRAIGLGGRERRAGSTTERARMSVTKALRSAIEKITNHDADLGAHLDASLRTGTSCSYLPRANGHVRRWEFGP